MTRRLCFLVLTMLFLAALVGASRPNKIMLREQYQVGQRWSQDFSLHVSMKLTYQVNGENQIKKVWYQSRERFVDVVLAVDGDGSLLGVRRRYERAVENKDGRRTTRWYQGKTVHLTKNGPQTRFRAANTDLSPAQTKLLAEALGPVVVLSSRPVGPGDHWLVSEKALRRFLRLPAKAQARVRCHWIRTIETAGRRVALIRAEMNVFLPLKSGLILDMRLKGRIQFDLTSRRVIAAGFQGPLKVRGGLRLMVARLPMTGHGRARMDMVRRPAN
ncbi:MAG: hypothetical protein KJ621_17710 [Proteobacteria bacterium]|nr:hypothetical protein [Pseudomonadota bacterium]